MTIQTCACIVVPVKDPDWRLEECIKAIDGQAYPGRVCVLLISSGHNKGFVSGLVRRYESRLDIILHCINPKEFQHGRTRNLAGSLVHASYYVFITQDAVPANDKWLSELIRPLDQDAAIAGSYSRHTAHPDHSIFCKHELEAFFLRLEKFPVAERTLLNSASSQSERDLVIFFSNNSSCIRGSLFRSCAAFPEVDFAEDQAWSAMIIQMGYKKAFCKDSLIHHSHHLSVLEAFGRGLDEARSFRKNHGRQIMGRNPISVVRSTVGLSLIDLQAIHNIPTSISVILQLAMQFIRRSSQSLGMYVGSSQRLSHLFLSWSRDYAAKSSTTQRT
jgi:rhamnosyltransferase